MLQLDCSLNRSVYVPDRDSNGIPASSAGLLPAFKSYYGWTGRYTRVLPLKVWSSTQTRRAMTTRNKRLKLLDASGVKPQLAKFAGNFDHVLRELLKHDDGLYQRVSAALNDELKVSSQPTGKPARPPKLRPQFAEIMLDRLINGRDFATLTLTDYFGDGKHGYKVIARLVAEKLVGVPGACEGMPPQLSQTEETRRRSLSYAASNVLKAITMKARNLDVDELAVLEIHRCGETPHGYGREGGGAGVLVDEKGRALLHHACSLLRRNTDDTEASSV